MHPAELRCSIRDRAETLADRRFRRRFFSCARDFGCPRCAEFDGCTGPRAMASLRPETFSRAQRTCLRMRIGATLILALLATARSATADFALESIDEGLMCSSDEAATVPAAPISVDQPAPACITECGDGLRSDDEPCDDGNFRNGDGCSESCSVESGFQCAGEPSDCKSICGNGASDDGESCDDGDLVQADGCSPDCSIERGWNCSGAPSVCLPECGDGAVIGTEQCDDGAINGTVESCCSERCLFRAQGSSCDDRQVCTAGDACNGSGRCQSSGPVDCSDGDASTHDVCDPQRGCQYSVRPPPSGKSASVGVVDKPGDRLRDAIAMPTRTFRSVAND
jgi:cysteine-rich repeat protein